MTLAVISPHLDDAAASVGQAIAARSDVFVVTVFAGIPDDQPNTGHDARSGFASGAEAMRARRDEDNLALAELGVVGSTRLAFLDGQYRGPTRDTATIAAAIAGAVAALPARDGLELLTPLGLSHPDHLTTAAALLGVITELELDRVFVYAELPYAELWPELLPPALADLEGIGFDVELVEWPTAPLERKATALEHYASQVEGLRMPAPLTTERIFEASS